MLSVGNMSGFLLPSDTEKGFWLSGPLHRLFWPRSNHLIRS